jgi:hypothetical protein
MPWRKGIGVIASAYRTEDPGFKSRQGAMFLEIYMLQCCCHNLSLHALSLFVLEKNKCLKNRPKVTIA